MKKLLNLIPLPFCGVILSLASLGSLFTIFKLDGLSRFFEVLAVIFMVLMLLKITFSFKSVKHEMQSPIIASVAPIFWMALMVISTFLPNYWVAILVWGISIIGHIGLIGYFYVHFFGHQRVKLQQVYPSWFILFVGFGVGAITSPHFNLLIGKVIFWCVI